MMKYTLKIALIAIGLIAVAATADADALHKNVDVQAAKKTDVWHEYEAEIDCSVHAMPAGKVLVPPSHGRIAEGHAKVPMKFDPPNPRTRCNGRRIEGLVFYYTSNAGFAGHDSVELAIATSSGSVHGVKVDIDVK